MTEVDILELFNEALHQLAQDIILLLPKILIALIIFVAALLVIKLLNVSIKKILKFADLDNIINKFTGFSLPLSLSTLLVFLVDLGIAIIAVYITASLFLEAQQIQLATEGLRYGARIISIIVISIFLFSVFGVVIGKIRVETRLRGYVWFIILLLVTAMLVDITALSDPVKNALTTGLSIGLGISIGIFAAWFFFHDYIERLLNKAPQERGED